MNKGHQYPLPLPHLTRMSAEDFMITDSNRDAAKWVKQWPSWQTSCLIIHGPKGSGKTHLAEVWKEKSGAKALIPPLSEDMTEAKHFLVDNADLCAGVAEAEEKLFHLFNRVKEEKGTILLTAAHPPAQWTIDLADLRSRLRASPAVALRPPDDDLVAAMLIKQFGDRQIQIESGVISYLVPRINRTPAFICDLVDRLDQDSLAKRKGITISLVRKMLESDMAADE